MNRIKNLREELNMTQQELADKLEGAKSTIAMYEKGDRKPSLKVLVKLSEIFNCSIDYLLGKTDIRNPEKQIKDDFQFAYHKESEGLSEEEIKEALEFYKLVKNRENNASKKEKNEGKK